MATFSKQIPPVTNDARLTKSEGFPQVELPKETNPYYPNQCPWYAVPTGRTDTKGQPQYAFFSRGMAITNSRAVRHDGQTYALDTHAFMLGDDFQPLNNPIATVKADAERAGLPKWAMNGDVSLVHAPENKAFLNAMLWQLGPELVKHVRADAQLPNVTLADIKNVKVVSVSNYGQVEGRSGNGRRIAISFDLHTPSGVVKMASDLSDPFFIDPTKGGQYGFVAPNGSFLGHQPVEHVRLLP
jgi:hypothetical protein